MRTHSILACGLAAACVATGSPTRTRAPVSTESRQQRFVHPGLLHTRKDFERIRNFVDAEQKPFVLDWVKLNAQADPDYVPNPHPTVWRGKQTEGPNNVADLFTDVGAAYVLAIRWKVGGGDEYAEAAARILDSWSSTLLEIRGPSDRFLASGLQGYQIANVAEILRGWSGWTGLDSTLDMLVDIFYSMNHEFTIQHLGMPADHYWANWDLANLASMMAIGVVADNHEIWNEAIEYFKRGLGMGAIENAIWTLHTENGTGKVLGQGQEAGRDQGHAVLDFALLGVIGQQAYSQGVDLWGYLDNRLLAGAEYMAKYNLGHDVPFTAYTNSVHGTHTNISEIGRGQARPIGELIYAHYASVKGIDARWIGAYRDFVVEQGGGSEGGVGLYGNLSGGYDQLGYGTLLFRRECSNFSTADHYLFTVGEKSCHGTPSAHGGRGYNRTLV